MGVVYYVPAQSITQVVMSNGGEMMSNSANNLQFSIGETGTSLIGESSTVSLGFWAGIYTTKEQVVTALIDQDKENRSIQAYPVPASERLHFQLPGKGVYEISIFNINGQLVAQKSTLPKARLSHIDIRSIPPGIYLAKVFSPATRTNFSIKFSKK